MNSNTTIRILLVDDDPDQILMMTDALSEYANKYSVVTASSGQTCLAMDLSAIDLVILDYNLPDMSGVDILRAVLKRKNLPVIMVTGEDTWDIIKQAIQSGAYDYIVKAGDYLRTIPLAIDKNIELHKLREEKNHMEEHLRLRNRELERTYAELKDAQQQLIQSEKMSSIGRLISGVAHELNNPLAIVSGYADLLLLNPQNRAIRADLENISKAADRATRIVRNLLSFARKHKLEKKYIGLHDVIQATIEIKAYQLRMDNIDVVLDFAVDVPYTMADPHQLQQVFLNLINNAHDALVESKGRGQITIRTERRDDEVRVLVIDDGPGIAKENLGKIFDPFFTTKEVGKGTGLGLSLCYGIIREHSGNIMAESVEGEGTTFIVNLPILPDMESYLDEAMEQNGLGVGSEPATPEAPPVGGKHILIIDDEVDLVDLARLILTEQGHAVDICFDAMSALEKIEQNSQYDLIISDIKIPGLSGKDFYHLLSARYPHLAERVLFVTGDTTSYETRSFLESIGNNYLEKPFKVSHLIQVVNSALKLPA
jgi:two-component system NtrC family sensor kinase